MIRRTPLRSSTPLRRGGELKRTPLARRTPLTSRPAPAASPSTVRAARRRRDTGPDAETTVLLWDRAGGRCELCGRDLVGQDASRHHRQPRGMGGSTATGVNALSNLLLLCGSGTTGCHGRVERPDRADAYRMGWLVRRPLTPADVGVALSLRVLDAVGLTSPHPDYAFGLVYLTDAGEYSAYPPAAA